MKIYHSERFDKALVEVAFTDSEGTFRSAYNFVTGTATTIPYNGVIPPDCVLKIPVQVWDDMLKEFAELASDKGLKLDSDLKREGKLEATERHLEDMRTLVFKKIK